MEPSEILNRAYGAWSAGADLRARRARCKRFTYGNQWSDPVRTDDGRWVTEDEALRADSKIPYTNNLIRQLVKTVVGRYRSMAAEGGYYGGSVVRLAALNHLAELDARALEEFLISGCAIQRVAAERRWNGQGVWVDNVDPRRFFVNSFADPRGWDIDLVGMLHDMSLPEVINRYAGGDHDKAAAIRKLYGTAVPSMAVTLGGETGAFFACADPGRCRVIEVWTFDSLPSDDGTATCDFRWHCRNFAPDGTVLAEYDSPYPHASHPFVVKFYPLTDGEVHSFVEDLLDQQKFINRLIATQEHILACSAKGVLLYPVDQLPEGFEWEDVSRAWAKPNGLVPVSGFSSVMPRQVHSAGQSPGVASMLEIQMKLFEQVSGVGNALMGRSTNARGADMLRSEIQSSTIALTDLYETFRSFAEQRNRKALAAA